MENMCIDVAQQILSISSIEVNNFAECINTLAAKLASKDSISAELQSNFLKLASRNISLPHTADNDLIDSFIAILVTMISINYESIKGLQALSVLFTYLKSDVRVFKRFYPTQELMQQLNLDRHLTSGLTEEKRITLDFFCFLLRYYEDVDYSDIVVDPKVIPRIRKAQLERTWIDIENLITNQEKIVKASRENQEMNSKAFTELFVFINEVKKASESSINSLHKEINAIKAELKDKGRQVNSEGEYLSPDEPVADLGFVKNMEAAFNERLEQLRTLVNKVMKEASEFEYKQEETVRKCNATANLMDNTAKKTEEIINMIKLDNKLLADTRSIMIARISKAEEDILTLMSKNIVMGGEVEPESIVNLRLDGIRKQIDGELMPKLNELQLKFKSMEIQQISVQGQVFNKEKDSLTLLISTLNEKNVNSISELINSGMDSVSKEVRGYKILLDSLNEQVTNIKYNQGLLTNNLNKETETNRKRNEKQELINSGLQKSSEAKYKELEDALTQTNINNTKSLSKLNELISQLNTDITNYKKVNNEAIKEQLKNVLISVKKYEERCILNEGEFKSFNLKLSALENESLKYVRQDEDKLRYIRIEDKLLRLPYIEEKITSIIRLEEKLNVQIDLIQKVNEDINDIRNKERSLIESIKVLETRPIPEVKKNDIDYVNNEFIKKIEQLKLQIQGNFVTSMTHIQKFTDQRAIDKLQKIKSNESNYTAKLNCLEWLLRYQEYLTGKTIASILEAFKQSIYSSRIYDKTAYASVKHSSNIMEQFVKCIREIKAPNLTEELDKVLSDIGTHMSILEIALINDQNVDTGISLGLFPELIRCILLLLSTYDPKKCRLEVKYSVRCLAYCFQNPKTPELLLDLPKGLSTVTSLIESSGDDEIIANCLKIIRTCLRNDKYYQKIVQRIPSLFTILIKIITLQQGSILLEEAAITLRQYTTKVYILQTIDDPNILEVLCRIVVRDKSSKFRSFIIDVLKNCCKLERLMTYIKKTGAYEHIPHT